MAKVLPLKIKQEIDQAASVDAEAGKFSRVGWVLKKIIECAAKGPESPNYKADPIAALKHVFTKHPKSVTPEFVEEVILPMNDVAMFKKAVDVIAGESKVIPVEAGRKLMMSALKHSVPQISDSWMRYVTVSSPAGVAYLIAKGAPATVRIDQRYGDGIENLSAIEYAVLSKTLTPELVKVLAKTKCEGGAKSKRRFVMSAIERGVDAVGVKALFDIGYKFAPEQYTEYGRSSFGYGYGYGSGGSKTLTWDPLSSAIMRGHKETAEAIIKIAKPDMTVKGDYGMTPLHCACKCNMPEIADLIASKRGVDVNAKDVHERTPMTYALDAGAKQIVEMLANRSKATLSGRVKIKRDNKDVSLTIAEYAKHCAEQADRRYKDTPTYPDIGETAYNDEYYFTIRGGDTVPVSQVEREHKEYRETLQNFARMANDVSRFVQAAAAPKPKVAKMGM